MILIMMVLIGKEILLGFLVDGAPSIMQTTTVSTMAFISLIIFMDLEQNTMMTALKLNTVVNCIKERNMAMESCLIRMVKRFMMDFG